MKMPKITYLVTVSVFSSLSFPWILVVTFVWVRLLKPGLQLPLDFDLVRGSSYPADVVLLVSLDQINSFEDICNIVDSPFCDFEIEHGNVKVKALVACSYQQLDELLGEFDETVLLATLLGWEQYLEALVLMFPCSGWRVLSVVTVPFALLLGRSLILGRLELCIVLLYSGRYASNSYIWFGSLMNFGLTGLLWVTHTVHMPFLSLGLGPGIALKFLWQLVLVGASWSQVQLHLVVALREIIIIVVKLGTLASV